MSRKLITIIAVVVIAVAGICIYSMKRSGCLESAEKLDLVQVAQQCIVSNKAATEMTTNYVSKRVKVEGKFKSLTLIPQFIANYLGLEGKNLHAIGLVYETKVQHKKSSIFDDGKTEDTPVLLECCLSEGEEKKVQGKKKAGDTVEIIGTVVDISRDGLSGSFVKITLKDCKVVN